MKTWEMIKELTENPEKEFICTNNIAELIARSNGRFIEIKNRAYDSRSNIIDLNHKWEEVKEPIPFMELIEKIKTRPSATLEHLNGTKFRVEHGLIDATSHKGNLWNLSEFVEILGMEFTDMQVRKILLEGKFYIED